MTTLITKYDLKNGGTTPTGAINRSVNEKLEESISVKDFGAVGDGIADDTVAIQNAIDSVTSTKRTIFLPAGTYKVTATLVISLEMTIYGTNRVGTVINYYGSG
ncbi:MAG: glycosyl hydrolase family 28-related protein, partial [Chthoniobacterales bacterium]